MLTKLPRQMFYPGTPAVAARAEQRICAPVIPPALPPVGSWLQRCFEEFRPIDSPSSSYTSGVFLRTQGQFHVYRVCTYTWVPA